jgi:hypothetical protein
MVVTNDDEHGVRAALAGDSAWGRRRAALVLLGATVLVAVLVALRVGSGAGHDGYRALLAAAVVGAGVLVVLVPANATGTPRRSGGGWRALTLLAWLVSIVVTLALAVLFLAAMGRTLTGDGTGWLLAASVVGLFGATFTSVLAGRTWMAWRRAARTPEGSRGELPKPAR